MIFRNTFRLIITNFSVVWKLLCYYAICIFVTILFCGVVAYPILSELNSANVFSNLLEIVNNLFSSSPVTTARTFEEVNRTILEIMSSSSYTFNYVFMGLFVFFILPVALDLAILPASEAIYGYMASQTNYSFTGRYFKSFKKSLKFALTKYLVMLPFNIIIVSLVYLMVRLATMGNVLYFLLDVFILAVMLLFISLKTTLFSCFAPAYTTLEVGVFSALKESFRFVSRKFGSIFSTSILLVLIAFALNLLFCVFTLTIGLIVTIPFTIFMFIVFHMVGFFSAQGGRYYIYTDTLARPETFEESQDIEKLKFLL